MSDRRVRRSSVHQGSPTLFIHLFYSFSSITTFVHHAPNSFLYRFGPQNFHFTATYNFYPIIHFNLHRYSQLHH
ncbi:Regulator of Ty1 transposition [Gossypium arboreum]|uniref:Regulator of Ty1 transposition n=1 Tax=Gossypium arboreum TaxID=29729 RepID=A0A0B0PEK0_GOSAR|nr:Regulator of Ty1 transposition [Gossypium arboreum]